VLLNLILSEQEFFILFLFLTDAWLASISRHFYTPRQSWTSKKEDLQEWNLKNNVFFKKEIFIIKNI